MWYLNVIEKDYVLKLSRISYNTVVSNKSRTSYKSAVSDFSLRTYDAGSTQICGSKNLRCLMYPYMLGYFFIIASKRGT